MIWVLREKKMFTLCGIEWCLEGSRPFGKQKWPIQFELSLTPTNIHASSSATRGCQFHSIMTISYGFMAFSVFLVCYSNLSGRDILYLSGHFNVFRLAGWLVVVFGIVHFFHALLYWYGKSKSTTWLGWSLLRELWLTPQLFFFFASEAK